LNWGKPQEAPAELTYRELEGGETLARLNAYSEFVLKTLRESVSPSVNYGEAAVKLLANDINTGRLRYNDDTRTQVANLYGAFLGTSMIRAYSGRWVQTGDGNVGVLFPHAAAAMTKIAFPITRVFKQIEQGDEFSIYSLFMSIPEFIKSGPRK